MATDDSLKAKRAVLAMLAVTALVLVRGMFAFFNDPEGPNLLVVVVTASVVYLASLAGSRWYHPAIDSKRFLAALLVQIALVSGLYLFLG